MMGFKDIVKQDIHRVFLNTDEHAEEYTIKYNEKIWHGIPAVLSSNAMEQRERTKDNHVQGLYLVTHVLYCALEDLDGTYPKQGKHIQLAGPDGRLKEFHVRRSGLDCGMLCLELEAVGR